MDIGRHESNGRFCKVVSFNGLLFVSGLVDIGHDAFEDQARGVFSQIDALLEKYGSSRERLLNANVYLKSTAMTEKFNSLWLEWVAAGNEPARTCIAAEMVHPQIQIEIAVIAAVAP